MYETGRRTGEICKYPLHKSKYSKKPKQIIKKQTESYA